MLDRRRVRTAVLAALATLPLAGLLLAGGLVQSAGAAEAATAFEPEPGSVETYCGPRWSAIDHWARRCGQTSANYGRTGYYNSDTNRGEWDEWRPVVSKNIVQKVVTATDGDSGCFYGYPQFRRASDDHTLTHGTQVVKTSNGTTLRVGYFDHSLQRFHPQSIVGHADPHLYPGDPKPSVCPAP